MPTLGVWITSLLLLFASILLSSCKMADEPECTPYNQQACDDDTTNDDDSADQPQLRDAYLKACRSVDTAPCNCYLNEEVCAFEDAECDTVCQSDCAGRIESIDECQQAVYGAMSEAWDLIFDDMVDCMKMEDCSDYYYESFEARLVACSQIQMAGADEAFVNQIYDLLEQKGCAGTRWPSLTGFWAPVRPGSSAGFKKGR